MKSGIDFLELAAGLDRARDHPHREVVHEARGLRRPHREVRRHGPERVVAPAQQRLRAADAPGAHVELRLELQRERVLLDRRAQPVLVLELIDRLRCRPASGL